MANLGQMLEQLREERSRSKEELDRLDGAIAAFEKLVGTNRRGAPRGPRAKRRFSAATRRRMAKAQKARWAKLRQRAATKA